MYDTTVRRMVFADTVLGLPYDDMYKTYLSLSHCLTYLLLMLLLLLPYHMVNEVGHYARWS